jgi:hypothetical protein
MDDKRSESRLGIELEVELFIDDRECSLKTRDLSNSGVYLEKGETNLPPPGTIVQIRVKSNFEMGEPPIVKARVVRVDAEGIALAFINDE